MTLRKKLSHPVVRYGLTLGVIAVAVLAIVETFDVGRAISVMANADLGLFLAGTACYYATFLVRTWRWQRFLVDIDVLVPTRPATLILVVGYYLNLVVPAKLGDVYRSYLVADDYGGSLTGVGGTVAAERVIDLFLLAGGLVILLPAVIGPEASLDSELTRWAGGLLVALCAVIAVVWVANSLALPDGIATRLESFQSGLLSATGKNAREATEIFGLSVSVWLLNVVRTWFVAASLGVRLSVAEMVLLALVIAFLSGLPYVPAGLGIVEVISTGLLVSFGVEAADALALVLLDRVISVLTLLCVGSACYVYLVYVRKAAGLEGATTSY